MDLLTNADVEALARRDHPGRYVSLFMPTHRFGDGVQADRIRWRNLLTELETLLTKDGMRVPDVAELLAPARDLYDDAMAWQYMSDGLALFIRPGWHRAYRVPVEVPAVGTVGERFVIGPLLRIVTGDGHFLVLALSQRRIRLLEGSMQHVEEVELSDVPTDLRQIIEPAEPRANTMTRLTSGGTGGRAGQAVFYGHGGGDENIKADEVRQFVRRVAQGLRGYLGDHDLPLVLVGLDDIVSAYREVNTYPHVTDEVVKSNPDQLSADELHAAAWPIVAKILEGQAGRAVDRFNELHGTGRTSNDLAEIEAAARDGRVATLLLAAQPWCWDRGGNGAPIVGLGSENGLSHCELLDRAAIDTLRRSGELYAVPAPEAPGGGDAAAVFRY